MRGKKTGGRQSIIRKTDTKTLSEIVKNSNSISEIMRKVGLKICGGSLSSTRKTLIELGYDISHIPVGLARNKGQPGWNCLSDEKLKSRLIKNSTAARSKIKAALLRKGWLKNKCYICNLLNIWNSKPLVLVLDHINGINNDNRLENLRLLCPNCNSQTPTFCGKNKKFKKSI